jgi:hypothetical protein
VAIRFEGPHLVDHETLCRSDSQWHVNP